MTTLRMRRVGREIALTLGATLGVLCLLTAVATPLFGVRLLVFQSGSMSPTIDTGGVALTRTVDAKDLSRGDIVSVTSSEGTRVTHRVADLTHDGARSVLTLRGDANPTPDQETYIVTSADRVLWHANGLGYVLRPLSSPYAVFLAGSAAVGLVVLSFRRRAEDSEGHSAERAKDLPTPGPRARTRRTAVVGTSVALAVLAGAGLVAERNGVVPTLASFTDTGEVTGSFATMTVPAPGASQIATDDDDVDCTDGTWLSGVVWVGWTAIGNAPANFQYLVDVSAPGSSSPDVTYTVTDKMATLHRGDLTHGAGTYQVQVKGSINGTTWHSIDSLERTIEVGSGTLDIRCHGPYAKERDASTDQQTTQQHDPGVEAEESSRPAQAPSDADPPQKGAPEPPTPSGNPNAAPQDEPTGSTDSENDVPDEPRPERDAARP